MKKKLILLIFLLVSVNYCQLKKLPKYDPLTKPVIAYVTNNAIDKLNAKQIDFSLRKSFWSDVEMGQIKQTDQKLFENLKEFNISRILSFHNKLKHSYSKQIKNKNIVIKENIKLISPLNKHNFQKYF